MVERRPLATAISHLVLILGVIVVAFPLYITFVASTHTAQEIVQTPMPLLPGPHLIENFTHAINGTSGSAASTAPVGRMMAVSLVTALVIAIGCTGGHHRSVAVAHELAEYITEEGYQVTENHRDISR